MPLLILAILGLVASFATTARAQEAADGEVGGEDEEAHGLFLAGRSAFSGGRFEEALGHFRHAHELSGHPELLFNIAVSADRLRRDDEAIEAFEQYLAEVPDADNRAEVESRLAILREQAPADPAEADRGSGPGVALWFLAGGGAAVAIAGGVLLGLAASSASTVESAMGVDWSTVRGDYDRANTFGVLGGILLVLGAVAMAGGLVWVMTGGGQEAESSASVRATVVPGGVVVGGTF